MLTLPPEFGLCWYLFSETPKTPWPCSCPLLSPNWPAPVPISLLRTAPGIETFPSCAAGLFFLCSLPNSRATGTFWGFVAAAPHLLIPRSVLASCGAVASYHSSGQRKSLLPRGFKGQEHSGVSAVGQRQSVWRGHSLPEARGTCSPPLQWLVAAGFLGLAAGPLPSASLATLPPPGPRGLPLPCLRGTLATAFCAHQQIGSIFLGHVLAALRGLSPNKAASTGSGVGADFPGCVIRPLPTPAFRRGPSVCAPDASLAICRAPSRPSTCWTRKAKGT